MRTSELLLGVCMKRKRIRLTRLLIGTLGNPSHLCFFFDEAQGGLIISAASKDDLDAYEIPAYYWKNTKQSCEMSRIAFLKALQYRFGWENGRRYWFKGVNVQSGNKTALIFDLSEEYQREEIEKSQPQRG